MEYKTLNQIATNFRYGKMPDKSKITDSGDYPVWSGYRYVGFYDGKNVNKDEIVVVARGVGGTGDVKICKEDCFLTNLSIAFNVNEDINPLYVYYYYQIKNLRYLDSGSAQSQITINDLKNVKIPIPSKNIQDKIVEVLNKLDQRIELNNEINNNLYEEAVALYKDKFKGIGQGKKTIGDYIVPKRGKNLLTRDAIDGDTPVVAGGIDPSAYHNQFNTKSPVITISASGANAGYTNLWNIPVWASDCSYIDDSITKNVYFWYIVLKTRQNEIFDAQTGSAQPHIYPQHIAEMSIGELNIAEVEKYNNLVAPLFKMIGENQKENKKLSQLRDALLPKLMNGEIDLDNIEI